MHTPKQYDKIQEQIEEQQKRLLEIQEESKGTKVKIAELIKQKGKMKKNTIGSLESQKIQERHKEVDKEYWEMIERWKEKLKDNEPALLDQLTEHYRVMIHRLSDNRKSIFYILIKAGRPLTTAEISTELKKIFSGDKVQQAKITPKYISATLNGSGMYSIPKSKLYKFEIFEKTDDGRISISNNDSYFKKWLEMRFKNK